MNAPIAIVGAGAVGCLLAGYFAQANIPCQLILRDRNEIELYQNQNGIIWLGEKKEKFNIPFSLVSDPLPLDLVLISTKAYDVKKAIQNIQHRLHQNSFIVVLANGLGLAEEILDQFPQLTLCLGANYSSAYKQAPFTIRPVSRGQCYFGMYKEKTVSNEQIQKLLHIFTHAGFDAHFESSILPRLWQKFAVNCVINPLTALLRVQNGELLDEKWFDIEQAICREIAQVAQAEQQSLSAEAIFTLVQQIASQTRENYTSMLQDVIAGHRTEMDYLNGYLVHRAQALHLPVPFNQLLSSLVTGVSADEKNLS